jgi:hypothetical protein
MITPINEVSCRLTVLEFMLGQEISKRLSMVGPDEPQKWREGVVTVFELNMLPDRILLGSEQEEAEILRFLKERLETFIRNVAAMEAIKRKAEVPHEATRP